MPDNVPQRPKIYHIVHYDRLQSIIADSCLWSDSDVDCRKPPGTTIGMPNIKHRRLTELSLASHPNLFVGECVPFYFCPRSVMLYMYHMNNHTELTYRGGQGPIVHLEADLYEVTNWADENEVQWAFTLSNAGSRYFEDRADLDQLGKIDWNVVSSSQWGSNREKKQAEFLIKKSFPWDLVNKIGVISQQMYNLVEQILVGAKHQPQVEIIPSWYY